jgi:hypothetical protein
VLATSDPAVITLNGIEFSVIVRITLGDKYVVCTSRLQPLQEGS